MIKWPLDSKRRAEGNVCPPLKLGLVWMPPKEELMGLRRGKVLGKSKRLPKTGKKFTDG